MQPSNMTNSEIELFSSFVTNPQPFFGGKLCQIDIMLTLGLDTVAKRMFAIYYDVF